MGTQLIIVKWINLKNLILNSCLILNFLFDTLTNFSNDLTCINLFLIFLLFYLQEYNEFVWRSSFDGNVDVSVIHVSAECGHAMLCRMTACVLATNTFLFIHSLTHSTKFCFCLSQQQNKYAKTNIIMTNTMWAKGVKLPKSS